MNTERHKKIIRSTSDLNFQIIRPIRYEKIDEKKEISIFGEEHRNSEYYAIKPRTNIPNSTKNLRIESSEGSRFKFRNEDAARPIHRIPSTVA